MYLETPKKFRSLANQAHQVAENYFRPISRKYDKAEHAYPKELDLLAALLDGMNSGSPEAVGATSASKRAGKQVEEGIKNGGNLSALLGVMELCWGDVGLLLAMPRQGLGNAAIAAVANEEQLQRFGGTWAAMAITEPGCGSDSAAIRTTATQDGDHYVLNGEKIFVTSGERADAVVVWATLNRNLGRAAIKSFVVEKGTPGMTVTRLEKKLGIKASDTASISFNDCRVPAANLLATPRSTCRRVSPGSWRPRQYPPAGGRHGCRGGQGGAGPDPRIAEEGWLQVRLQEAAADRQPRRGHSLSPGGGVGGSAPVDPEGGMDGRQQAAQLEGSVHRQGQGWTGGQRDHPEVRGAGRRPRYAEDELLEKWARDSKILDIFEGTQQIQLLIVARRLLGKSSSQLK